MRMKHRRLSLSAPILAGLVVVAVVTSQPAWAYVGPGAGLTAIGSALAVLAAIFLGLVGFVWYPVRRLLRKMKSSSKKSPGSGGDSDESGQ